MHSRCDPRAYFSRRLTNESHIPIYSLLHRCLIRSCCTLLCNQVKHGTGNKVGQCTMSGRANSNAHGCQRQAMITHYVSNQYTTCRVPLEASWGPVHLEKSHQKAFRALFKRSCERLWDPCHGFYANCPPPHELELGLHTGLQHSAQSLAENEYRMHCTRIRIIYGRKKVTPRSTSPQCDPWVATLKVSCELP